MEILNIRNPQIKIYNNFFSEKDCEKIINLSKGNLKQPGVGINSMKKAIRTGKNCFIKKEKNSFTLGITKKIAKTLGLNSDHSSELQIVYYAQNQTYAYHYDAYPKGSNGKLLTPRGQPYQRKISTICYLNNVIRGGETYFPKIDISIKPELGKMLVFSNTLDNTNDRDPNSMHAGLPVFEGEKWILVNWFYIK